SIESILFDAGSAVGEKRATRSKVGRLFAAGQEEPQLVLLDGAANRAVEVLDLIDRELAADSAGDQFLIDVVTDKVRMHPAEKQIAVKLVAAILGNHVGVNAAC